MIEQMELPLWKTLRSAQMTPEQTDFEGLLTEVEEAISQVPESEQLRLAGEAFLRLTEVYAARSEAWIEEWEQSSRDPVVERGFFDDLVRQTMAVDLSELMESAPPRKQRTKRETRQEGSIVAEVEKAAVLAIVDQMEAESARKEEVLAIAHDEDVSAWSEAIRRWFQVATVDQVQFVQLCQGLEMPRIEVWLGVLLGRFELELQDDFYSGSLWVRKLSPDSFHDAESALVKGEHSKESCACDEPSLL